MSQSHYSLHKTPMLLIALIIALVGVATWINHDIAERNKLTYAGRMISYYDGQLKMMKEQVANSCAGGPTGLIPVGDSIVYNGQEYRCALGQQGKKIIHITPLSMLK